MKTLRKKDISLSLFLKITNPRRPFAGFTKGEDVTLQILGPQTRTRKKV
jgi:hypothetical protein